MMPPLAIAGPTASNKSRFALPLAEKLGGEIISVDSGAVYQHMDIGAAKPPAAAQQQVRHHLLDVCAPDEHFSAGTFYTMAKAAIDDIHTRGGWPLLVGGTMMYFNTLLSGLHNIPPVPPEVRQTISSEMQEHGTIEMHRRLAEIDPESAAKIPPTDMQRISRALEVWHAAGRPLSEFLAQQKQTPAMALEFIMLVPENRAGLRESIRARLQGMWSAGLLEETNKVMTRFKLTEKSHSLRMAGYRQAAAHLRGEYDKTEMEHRAYYATCQLAKRQLTWIRQWRKKPAAIIDPFAPDAGEKIAAAIHKIAGSQ